MTQVDLRLSLLQSLVIDREGSMRKILVGVLVALVMAVSAASVGTTRAKADPSNECYGAIASGIAATWPWAHEGQMAFPPPPGAIRLWLELFGPAVGVSSVRELQILFCG
jgi:hypothetical protein